MAREDDARWRKSSYSGNNGGDCVEVRDTRDAVRDSKNPDTVLTVDAAALVRAIRSGNLG